MRRAIPTGLTNTSVHAQPVLTLPPAGGTFRDPVFGSTILRATDERHGGDCVTAYSYWPTLNRDSTRLLVRCDGNPYVFPFEPRSMKLGRAGRFVLPFDSAEDAIWSGLRPSMLYGRAGALVMSHDIATGNSSTLFDTRSLFPGVESIKQLSRSIDDRVFAFTLQGPGYSTLGYGAVRMGREVGLGPTRAVLDVRGHVDECQVNKNGRWLYAQTGQSGAGVIEGRVHNLSTGKTVGLTDDGPDFAPGHADQGIGVLVGHDNWRNQLTVRNLAKPHEPRTLLQWPEWGGGYHTSMLADGSDTGHAIVSTYGFSGLYAGEIMAVPLAGGPAHRLCHHRSEVASYEDEPRANVSRDGRWVAFTARVNGRRDVFLLRVGA